MNIRKLQSSHIKRIFCYNLLQSIELDAYFQNQNYFSLTFTLFRNQIAFSTKKGRSGKEKYLCVKWKRLVKRSDSLLVHEFFLFSCIELKDLKTTLKIKRERDGRERERERERERMCIQRGEMWNGVTFEWWEKVIK
jgi:hypothetical protein